MDIGNALKELRKLKGFNQKDASNGIGITQAYLSRIELGQKHPSTDLLKRVTNFYKVPFPLIYWKSVDVTDIQPDKQQLFLTLKPAIDDLINKVI